MERGNGIVLMQESTEESQSYAVPFFVPAVTTTTCATISSDNMMKPNIDRTEYSEETEGSDTRFLLTNVHWTFTEGSNSNTDEAEGKAQTAEAAGFYRMHKFVSTDYTPIELAEKNTLGANKAYLAVPTINLPTAVWNLDSYNASAAQPVRRNSIAIRGGDISGITDIHDSTREAGAADGTDRWYTVSGQRIERPLRPGLYILNGRKVVVK